MSMQRRIIFDEDHVAFRDSVAKFVAANVGPHASISTIWPLAANDGITGLSIPEEFGGAGIEDQRFVAVLLEELASVGAFGLAVSFGQALGVAIPALVRFGGPGMHAAWLPDLAAGESLCAVHCTDDGQRLEPGASGWSGSLTGVVNGSAARLLLVAAGDENGASGAVPLSIGDPGSVTRTPVAAWTQADIADFRIRDALAAEGGLLSAEAVAQMRSDEQLWLAVIAVAGARAIVDWTLAYVRERKVFGQPLMRFDNTRDVLGALAAQLAVVGSFIDQCLVQRANGPLVAAQTAAAKLAASKLIQISADQGLQLHGGYGYMREYPIAQAFADARCFGLLGGSNEALKRLLALELGSN